MGDHLSTNHKSTGIRNQYSPTTIPRPQTFPYCLAMTNIQYLPVFTCECKVKAQPLSSTKHMPGVHLATRQVLHTLARAQYLMYSRLLFRKQDLARHMFSNHKTAGLWIFGPTWPQDLTGYMSDNCQTLFFFFSGKCDI